MPNSNENLEIKKVSPDSPVVVRRSTSFENQPVKIEPLKGTIEGYPIVFNQRALIAGLFYEEIDPHALDGADLSDIKFFINHNDSMIPLARHRRGKRSTMDVAIDGKGMSVSHNLQLSCICSRNRTSGIHSCWSHDFISVFITTTTKRYRCH